MKAPTPRRAAPPTFGYLHIQPFDGSSSSARTR